MVGVETRGGHLGLHEGVVALAQQSMGSQKAAGHLPTGNHIARQHQVGHAARIGGVGVAGRCLHDELHHVQQGLTACGQALGDGQGIGRAKLVQSSFGGLHLRGQGLGCLATITRGFAAHQIVGLNRGRAFVNGQDFRVAVILRRTGFFNEAHAAMHLHTQRSNFQTHLGAVALDQRHHEFIHGVVLLAGVGVGVVVRSVIGGSGHRGHGAAAFGVSPHGHQHAAHIGVVNDGCSGLDAAVHGAALHTVTRILRGLLIGPVGHRNALHAHRIAGRVHHDEHVFQTTVFLAHQKAHGTAMVAVLQYRCGAGFDAHFVFDADAMHIVACTQ